MMLFTKDNILMCSTMLECNVDTGGAIRLSLGNKPALCEDRCSQNHAVFIIV